MNKEIKQYIIDKYCGGRANTPPAKNIQICLQPGYEFSKTKVFGKEGLTIKKKNGKNS